MKTYLRKSLLTIATLLLAAVTVSAEPKDVEYVLSTQTYVDNTNDSVWNFKNDFTISNEKGKTYGTGKENGFKFSAGVQYTILLPDGLSVNSITVSGYDNYPDLDAYIKEVNGTQYAETDYVFPMKTSDTDYVVASYTFDFSTPLKGEFTITPAGKQVVWTITVKGTIDYEAPAEESYAISSKTYVDSPTTGEWNFQEGFTVVNVNAKADLIKAYSTGLNNSVKYSRGVQFTVKLPDGFVANSVLFSGFGNDNSADAYLGELNGNVYGESDYVFPHRIDSKHADMANHQIAFDAPVTGQFTFTPLGAQAGFIITVNGAFDSNAEKTATYKIAISTHQDIEADSVALWYFNDDISITNENKKAYGGGKEDGVKFSPGTQYTIHLPKNFALTSAKFTGYDNYTEVDSYLREVNGETYDPTAFLFPQKNPETEAYTVVSHNIQFDTPVTKALTFTPAGKQVVLVITLTGTLKEDAVLPGDANDDGEITVTDIMAIVNYCLGKSNPTFNEANANFNQDDDINVTDIMLVVNYLLGKN